MGNLSICNLNKPGKIQARAEFNPNPVLLNVCSFYLAVFLMFSRSSQKDTFYAVFLLTDGRNLSKICKTQLQNMHLACLF